MIHNQIMNLATDDQNCYTAVDAQANVIIIILLLLSAICQLEANTSYSN